MKKLFSILFALALVVSLGLVTAAPVVADGIIISVPGDYPSIQAAIDAAEAGDTIVVAAGEYEHFLVLEKQDITITSTEGATVTTASSFSINRGFIEDAWVMAAVWDSENIRINGINVNGSTITGEQAVVGIAYVDSTGSIVNLTVESIIGTEVGAGVAIIGAGEGEAGVPTVEMKGSTISGNAVGIYVCDDSTLEAHFNRIVGNTALGIHNDGGEPVDATYSWWGSPSGPFHSTNPTGAGNAVSDNVIFEPWTAAEVVTETVVGDDIVDAKAQADTEVEVWVKGTTTVVTVVPYPDNPTGVEPSNFIPLHKHIDVYIHDTDEVEQIEIRLYYTDDDIGEISQALQQYLKLLWWDDSQWRQCSISGVNTTAHDDYAGYMWARIRDDTTPSLTYLQGGEFGGYGGPTEPPGFCFIATAAYGTDTAQELGILREFRDMVLLPSSLGAKFVSFYYRASPPIASFISRHEVIRTAVRVGFIDPIVKILNRTHHLWSDRGSSA